MYEGVTQKNGVIRSDGKLWNTLYQHKRICQIVFPTKKLLCWASWLKWKINRVNAECPYLPTGVDPKLLSPQSRLGSTWIVLWDGLLFQSLEDVGLCGDHTSHYSLWQHTPSCHSFRWSETGSLTCESDAVVSGAGHIPLFQPLDTWHDYAGPSKLLLQDFQAQVIHLSWKQVIIFVGVEFLMEIEFDSLLHHHFGRDNLLNTEAIVVFDTLYGSGWRTC